MNRNPEKTKQLHIIDSYTKLQAALHYLNNKTTLKQTALLFKIHYLTLFKYVTFYRKYGAEKLMINYHKPWNRTDKKLEEKIVQLKENNPGLTVKKAQEILKKKGIKISTKCIWSIWRRYGYAGFDKTKLSTKFTEYIPWSNEARVKYEAAKDVFSRGNVKRAARILNSIPALPNNDLLPQIPDAQLNIPRRIEKIAILYGNTPVSPYLAKLRQMKKILRNKGLYYSTIRLTILEAFTISWLGESKTQLNLTLMLNKFIQNNGNRMSSSLFPFKFLMSISEGVAYARLLNTKEAYKRIKFCHRQLMSCKFLIPYFMEALGVLYTHVDDFNKAEQCYTKVLNEYEKKGFDTAEIRNFLSSVYHLKGDYKKAIALLKSINTQGWHNSAKYLLIQATRALVNAMPHRSLSFSSQAVNVLKKEGIRWGIYSANIIAASAYYSLGEKTKAINILKKTICFVSKNYKKEELILKNLLSHLGANIKHKLISKCDLPRLRLIQFLKNKKYFSALKYARQKGIVTDLQRWAIFFPELITENLAKGKSIGLPRAMLHLPILNNQVPVYHIKFLGKTIVYKNQQYLKTNLNPKDLAFLIYLCTRAMEPKKSLNLDEVYRNFWPNSEKAPRNFSHLLVRIKKELKIPSHLLTISRSYGENYLINNGIYFTTDYQEFEQTIARAKALQRAGEWEFAKKEFLQAFKLIRGEPFKKNFDNWSVNMRFRILSELENEAINFAKACLEHNNKYDAKKILEKVLKIMPDSEEIIKLSDSLIGLGAVS